MKRIFIVLTFLCLFTIISGQNKFVDSRDGRIYRTITFSGMTWMAENLKFKAKSGAFYFDNDTNNIKSYGVLYEWKGAVSACPVGWHLPSGPEFQQLYDYLEQNDLSGKLITGKDTFHIQLAGMQDYEGTFSEMDESGYYWTSTEYDNNNAEYFSYLIINEKPIIDISRKADIADIHGTEKTNKYSVRCVKN